ncbi:MAG: hypothetical protein WCC64_11845 [Aliidongia sp.]
MSGIPFHDDAPRINLLMRSSRWVNLYDPAALDIVLSDWVTGASRVARWGGQTKGDTAYNVLQHSDLVERILVEMVWPNAPRTARLLAKAHDLHEGGGLGDVVTPYSKLFAQAGLQELKARLDKVLFLAIGLPSVIPDDVRAAVKRADMIAAVSEAVQLLDWPEKAARRDVGHGYRGPLWPKEIVVIDERQARDAWWRGYRLLGGKGCPPMPSDDGI